MARVVGQLTDVRVLQVVLSLNPGGTERLVLELARRLNSELPMAVCCLDERGAWASELTSVGIDVRALARPSGFRPWLGGAVAKAARDHNAAVVHCHHYSPFVYGGLARLWQPRLRVVYTEHGRLSDAPPSAKRRAANALFGRFPSAVYAVSQELRQHLIEEGFSPRQTAVIYNGIDVGAVADPAQRVSVRDELDVRDETLVIGTIARLDPVKDLGTLIEALSLLTFPSVLVIIGDGPEGANLRRQAAALGISDRVRFLGQRNDARRWLAGCDAYVNSSISEGVSLTILEAMAASLPVIATRVGGTPEVIDEESGTLVPPRDAASLSRAIEQVYRERATGVTRGAAGRRRVETQFTLDRMVAEYRTVYERLARL